MAKAVSSSTNAKIEIVALAIFPILLYCIPLEWVLEGDTLCLYHNMTGHDCYGCGMTRALFSLLHFDFHAAWTFNRLVVVVAPLLTYLYIKEVIRCLRLLKKS